MEAGEIQMQGRQGGLYKRGWMKIQRCKEEGDISCGCVPINEGKILNKRVTVMNREGWKVVREVYQNGI